MPFASMTAEQYRALDAEQLEARVAEIAATFDDPDADIDEVTAEGRAVRAEMERRSRQAEVRSLRMTIPASPDVRVVERIGDPKPADDDMYASEGYMRAFMGYASRGLAIPAEYRADGAFTHVADAGAVVPTTLMQTIVRELEKYGEIYSRVTKLNVQGGVQFPVSTVRPVATWIDEDNPSADQKLEAKDYVTFSYYGLECKIAQSLLVNVTTISAFQSLFSQLATEAFAKALDTAIVKGSGTGCPLGIVNDSRIANVVEMTEAEFSSWEKWHKKFKAAIKPAYRDGQFIMAQSTYDGYIDGMVDTGGQPVGRVNYGIDGEETKRFIGREVLGVENALVPDFADAAAGDVVAIYGKLSDYAINSNMQMTAKTWVDEDANLIKNKLIMVADGKVVDPHGYILIKKKA